VSKSRGNNLVALGSAAVLMIYTAGFVKTKPAADRMAAESGERRPRSASRAGTGAAGPRTAAGESGETVVPAMTATIVKSPTATRTSGSQLSAVEAAATPTVTATVTAPTTAPVSALPVATPPVTPPTAPVEAEPTPSAPAPTAPAPVSAPVPVAEPAAPTVTAPAQKPATKTSYKDGVYLGRGTSRHGDIEAMVEIRDGRITNTVISQCLTRYSCSWIAVLLPQVVARQSAEVDYVSGATVSSDAFYYAVTQALAQAK